MAKTEAEKINFRLVNISNSTAFVQQESARYLLASESFPLPAGKPKFSTASNGAFFKIEDNGGCSLFYGRRTKIGNTELRKAEKTELFDPLYKAIVQNSPLIVAVYFNSFDQMNRYYPFLPDIVKQYDPDLQMQKYNFYYLADIKHNPSRKPVWTGAYLDPAGFGWMISCVAPIYRASFLEGVVGLDITIDIFVKSILDMKLPYNASAFLVDKDGMILAMSKEVEEFLNLTELKQHVYSSQIKKELLKPEDFNLRKHPQHKLAQQFLRMEKENLPYVDVVGQSGEAIIFQNPIKETAWRLMIVVERNEIFRPVQIMTEASQGIVFIVLIILCVSCALFYLMISRRSKAFAATLARPIISLSKATGKIGTMTSLPQFEISNIKELDQLGENFLKMSIELESRTEKLIQSQLREKMQAKESELAFTSALFEVASQKAQKLESLGLLAGGIAHDFNNCLTGIFGFIEMAFEETTEAKVSDYLAESLGSIDRARSLTQQLLTFAKGGAPIKQVGKLFPFVEKTVQFALSGSTILCKFFIQENLYLCDFDKNQIGQVIDNLTINAKQAMPNGGIIEVSAKNISLTEKEHTSLAPGDYVKISIKDQGAGIQEGRLSHIFDPYYTTKAKGQGLGLYTCYSILKRHEGCIDVESKLGSGSTFHIYLPSSQEVMTTIFKKSLNKHIGEGTFLVMDDDEPIRMLLKKMLESFGYTVILTENGKQAVDCFMKEHKENRKLSGMIFDLTVPGGVGGAEAMKKIRQICSDTPAFVVSGYSDDPILANPEKYGFCASLSKPFKREELSNMLERYLNKHPNKA